MVQLVLTRSANFFLLCGGQAENQISVCIHNGIMIIISNTNLTSNNELMCIDIIIKILIKKLNKKFKRKMSHEFVNNHLIR